MAHVILLGAGLTGLSCAYHLEQQGFYDYEMFEKENRSGGLCRSHSEKGFTFDYTGHLLHISDPYFREFIARTIRFDQLEMIQRRSFIYSHETFIPYPFQTNLHGLPPSVITECIESFIKRKKYGSKNPSFYQWVINNFGKGIGRHFFFPYQEKIFATNVRSLSASWTGRFVPKTSLKELIEGALHSATKPSSLGYNAQFFYPRSGGIESWITSIKASINKPIHTGYEVINIDPKNKRIEFSNGAMKTYTQLISTLPLVTLLKLFGDKSKFEKNIHTKQLKAAGVINFNIGIQRADLSEKHWIYYPEKQFPFYRIGFHHNFSKMMTPPGCSSLYGEFSYKHMEKKKIEQMISHALQKTKSLFSIHQEEIIVEKIINIPHAYVIFDHWRDKHLPHILSELTEQQIHSVGRYGAWKYSSMQEGVLDGKLVAEKILNLIK